MPTPKPTQDLILQQILTEFQRMNTEIGTLRTELKVSKDILDLVALMIRGSATVQSIPTQIALLGSDLNNLKTDVQDNKDTMENMKSEINSIRTDTNKAKHKHSDDKTSRTVKATIAAALITGILGMIGALVTLLK